MDLRTLVLAVAAAGVASGCGFESKNTVAPTSTTTPTPVSSGASTAASMVGIWMSNTLPPGIPDPRTCGNFQYQIDTQTKTSLTGTFTGQCGTGMIISGSASGQLNGSAVTVSASGSATGVPNNPTCTFSLTASGTLQDGGNTLPFTYAGTTCLGPVQGSETLRRPSPASSPAPTPAPTPTPTPTPAPPPVTGDVLIGAAVYGGSAPDVASWPVTTTISEIDFNGGGVHLTFSKQNGPDRWPDVVPPGWGGPLQYTVWMVVNVNGRWATSGGVEFWYGLDRSGGPPSMFAQNWYYNPQIWGPLATHQPAVGEHVGFFVTAGDERAKDFTAVRERSNVVVIPFPSDAGAAYQF